MIQKCVNGFLPKTSCKRFSLCCSSPTLWCLRTFSCSISVVDYIGRLQNDFINVDTAYANLFGVVVLYLPAGLLLPLSSEKTEKYGKVILTVGGFALTVELLQWLVCIGQFDIDDILFALIGCSIGYGIYALVRTIAKKAHKKLWLKILSAIHIQCISLSLSL